MFKLPSLVRLPKHKQFDYIPRYYDSDKEEMQERLAEKRNLKNIINKNENEVDENPKNENINSEESREQRLSMAFREARRSRNMYQTADRKSTFLRLGLILLFMAGFTLWFFAGEEVTNYLISGDNRTTFPLILACIFGAIIIKNILNFKR